MHLDFPAAPVLNATYTAAGIVYTWNGYAWVPGPQTGTFRFELWPAGIGVTWWGIGLPSGTLWCDGSQYDPAVYAALYAAIGTSFNTGGETAGFFRVPDERGRLDIGRDDMGGTTAGRIDLTGGHGINGVVLGAKGGTQSHTLSIAQMPAHQHPFQAPTVSAAQSGSGVSVAVVTPATALSTDVIGSTSAHPNVQPAIVCNKIITLGGSAP